MKITFCFTDSQKLKPSYQREEFSLRIVYIEQCGLAPGDSYCRHPGVFNDLLLDSYFCSLALLSTQPFPLLYKLFSPHLKFSLFPSLLLSLDSKLLLIYCLNPTLTFQGGSCLCLYRLSFLHQTEQFASSLFPWHKYKSLLTCIEMNCLSVHA